MNYIFFGGRDSPFAQIILDGLKSAGWQPMAEFRDAKAPIDLKKLKALGADFFLVAAFGKILKKDVLNINKVTDPNNPIPVIGVHPSLLPRLRGPSPIQSTLLNDEKQTGVTLFLIDEKVDHGPVISYKSLVISDKDNYQSLEKKLAELSVNLILETMPKYLAGEIKPQPQDEPQATYTKKFTTEDAKVNLKTDDPKQIWLKIRALNPEPGTYTILTLKNGKTLRLKLLETELSPISPTRGERSRTIGLILKKVQPEGKRPMTPQSFLNGYQKFLDQETIERLTDS